MEPNTLSPFYIDEYGVRRDGGSPSKQAFLLARLVSLNLLTRAYMLSRTRLLIHTHAFHLKMAIPVKLDYKCSGD